MDVGDKCNQCNRSMPVKMKCNVCYKSLPTLEYKK